MALHIRNPEAHRLAKELAQLTGETMTEAVTVALQERLGRVRMRKLNEDVAEQLLAIGRETGPLFPEGFTSSDVDELLYDQDGLPK